MLVVAMGPVAAQTIHVSPSGSDTADGSPTAPVRSITKAIELGGTLVLLESGEYINETGLQIPAGSTVRGGHSVTNGVWQESAVPSVLLNTALNGEASVVLLPIADEGDDPARLEWLQILGGFVSVEMRRGAELYEVELGGGTSSAIFVGDTTTDSPAVVTRCEITGGQTGIRIVGTGSARIEQTLTRNTLGAGMTVQGTGTVTVDRSVFQTAGLEGLVATNNSNLTIVNSAFRRNLADGLRLVRSNALVRGCLFERNENGVSLEDTALARVENCSVALSREAGILVTRGNPVIERCIIAHNSGFGVVEERPEVEPGQPSPPPTVELFAHNIVFANDGGVYLDEGVVTIETEGQLNANLINRQAETGNAIADPLFVNLDTANLRVTAGSPAIDRVTLPGLGTDSQGNARGLDIAGVGVSGANAVDAGAFEYLGAFAVSDSMGLGYFDQSIVTDSDEPGAALQLRRNPVWEFNPANPFKSMRGTILPGRMRITAFQDQSVAFGWRRSNDIAQPNAKVLRIRTGLQSRGTAPRMTLRLRTNWDLQYHSAVLLTVDGPQAYAPPAAGREYPLLVDLAQGNYANQNATQLPSIPYLFNLDTISFGATVPVPPLDLTSVHVDVLDRAAVLAEYTEEAAAWSFAANEEGWVAEEAIPGYGSPIRRHSAARGALEHAQLQFFSYGTWRSPLVDLEPGTEFLIRFRVSSDRPRETSTSFRVRASDVRFLTTNELVITAGANGEATPVPEGREYTLLGTVCPFATEPGLRFYWDLYGFDSESRGGSIFLENVTILTKPNS